ncbi:MAG: YggS family pyridoxal phosphate-dependent enzyme [Clostridiales bacterium]|nr:YggS family pyridoxal phosphate-dependent enzyme [Clostridiales bacterium]
MQENLRVILDNINKYKTVDNVTIVCASKTRSAEIINTLPSFSLFTVGENKVQELLEKYDDVDKSMTWHFIGQLQTNKVKYIIDKVSLIESVDRKSLADEIDKQAKKHGIKMSVLVEINAGAEESKGGVTVENVEEMLSYVKNKENLELKGIMSVFPVGADESLYAKIKHTYDAFKDKYSLSILSMGMSNDYVTALKYGATEIRLGTALFGARDYSKR